MVKKYSFFNGTFFPLNLTTVSILRVSLFYQQACELVRTKKQAKIHWQMRGIAWKMKKNTFEPSNMKFDFTAQHFQYTG